MPVRILIFGQLADITGNNDMLLEDIADTNSLMALMNTKYPALRQAKFIIAVDKKVISENTILNNTSIVALLPAFSGG
jgi:molybdopterin converting factor small subunit